MSKWKSLIEQHKKAQKVLVLHEVVNGATLSEAARNLGMPRQQLYKFCKANKIEFNQKISNPSKTREMLEIIEKVDIGDVA